VKCKTCKQYLQKICTPDKVLDNNQYCELEVQKGEKARLLPEYRSGRVPGVKTGGW